MASKKKALSRADLAKRGIPLIFFPGLLLASILGWDHIKGLEQVDKSGGYKNSQAIFPKKAVVTKVLDGDTVDLENGQSVRFIGVNAPNEGEPGFEKSRDYLRDLVEGEEVELEYDTYQEDKYGRLLAYVFEECKTSDGCRDGKRMINRVMIKNDLAKFVKYKDRRKLKYEEYLQSAE